MTSIVTDDIDAANPPIGEREESENGRVEGVSAADVMDPVTELGARVPPPTPTLAEQILEIALDDIAPDPAQARDEGADDSIGDTLLPTDVLPAIELRVHPHAGERCDTSTASLLVGVTPDGSRASDAYPPFMIIDGERRWRGSRKAGRTTIRAWVNPNPGDDGDRLLRQAALNEGQRLKPMEEARTWKRIKEAKGFNINQLADAVKRPKSTVSDRLALLDAPASFHPFFLDGTLTAAAAPIVRSFADVRTDVVERIVQQIQHDYQWQQCVNANRSVPLPDLERAIGNALQYPFSRVEDDARDYPGETFEVKGKRYAVDRPAYLTYRQQQADERAGPGRAKSADDSQKRQAEETRKRRVATEKKKQLRRAQFDAITAKLPTSIDGAAALFVIESLATEMQQLSQIAACKGLGIAMPKKTLYGADHRKLLIGHAEKLDGKSRVRMLLQLAMAGDLQVSEYDTRGPERIGAAAKLVRVDLKKIQLPADEKPGKSLVPVHAAGSVHAKVNKTAKKSPAKKRSPPAFMQPQQPSAALAAIVGTKAMPRTEITKKLWAYIKAQKLQDATNRRQINADLVLQDLFNGATSATMFELPKYVGQHITPVKD